MKKSCMIASGVASNDTIVGGRGDDMLDTGDGNDRYYYNKGDGTDCIIDSAGNDSIILAGFDSMDKIEYKPADLLGFGSIICNGETIIYISERHTGTVNVVNLGKSYTVVGSPEKTTTTRLQ